MATIKSYTDLEQSRKLAQILPLESADMYYWCADHYPKEDWIIEVGSPDDNYECICAWSLAALLGVLPRGYSLGRRTNGKYYICMTWVKHDVIEYDNPVDACVAMIENLHELKIL